MHLSRFLLLLFALANLLFTNAQTSTVPIQFKIVTAKNEPVAFATVIVSPATDSSRQVKKVSDSTGLTSFQVELASCTR